MLLAPSLATRNKRPLGPKASLLIENKEAGMRKRSRGGAPISALCVQSCCAKSVNARGTERPLRHSVCVNTCFQGSCLVSMPAAGSY